MYQLSLRASSLTVSSQHINIVTYEKPGKKRWAICKQGFLDTFENAAFKLRVVCAFSKNGGIAAIKTALLTRSLPYS